MDINKIFGSFNSSSKDDGFDKKSYNYMSPRTLPNIDENHPRYYIKMFIKLVHNYTSYNTQLINFFGSADPDLDTGEIQRTGEIILYERAMSYLTEIDIQDKYHIKVLFEEANEKLESALNKCLKHFEDGEEYEKCIIIKKYLDFLNFSS